MANEIICLDTSVLIDFYRKKDKTKSFFYQLAQGNRSFAVSVITEYEIFTGSNTEQDQYWNDFFQRILVLPFDTDTNKTAIIIERNLKAKRKQIDKPDLFIGATALKNKMKLATLNRSHFERIDGLVLINN